MTQDARCIIKGTGTIDNYPASGVSTACNALGSGWTVGIIGSSAEIVQPSISDGAAAQAAALKCYLYCDATKCGSWYGSSCKNTSGWPHGPGSVDIINYHDYAETNNPETHSAANVIAVLETNELNKPLWVGEGSWDDTYAGGNIWQDPYAQGGFIPRWFASVWAQTLPQGTCSWTGSNAQVCQQAFWYGYDYDTTTIGSGNYSPSSTGALYCAGETAHGWCGSGPPDYTSFLITPQASMWNVAVDWLTGAQPNSAGSNPFCNLAPITNNKTVWECYFTKGGLNYLMVWDNQYAQSGNSFCGSFPNANP